jgi:hypothetical protein
MIVYKTVIFRMPFSSLNWRQYKVGYKKEAWTSIVATFNNAYSNLFYWRVAFPISLMAINTSTNTLFIIIFLVISKSYRFMYKNTCQYIKKSETWNNKQPKMLCMIWNLSNSWWLSGTQTLKLWLLGNVLNR